MQNILFIKLFDNYCRKCNEIKISLCYIYMQIFFENYCKCKVNVKCMIIQYTYKGHICNYTNS